MKAYRIDVFRRRRLARAGVAALVLCLAWALFSGCAEGAASSAYSSAASSDDADAVVSNENRISEERAHDDAQNVALKDAEPLGVVTWTEEPAIGGGELKAAGELQDGAALFMPQDGDGYAFSVRYKTHEDPMVILLPDLGPTAIWQSFHTIADMEIEVAGAAFSFRAYSPLFMDVGGGDLELRVYGYDKDGNPALLAVQPLGGE